MNYKKVLIIIFAVIFFLTALTFYLNRIIFPQLIKKVAIERIEETIKRKVEIGSIHFNWVRGFIIDQIKVYEKNSNEIVFAQADQVSFGIIFFPGLKHPRVTIPYINVRNPSVHLLRSSADTWNFSDLYARPTTATPVSNTSKEPKSAPLEIAWGGITINDGKLMIDDTSNGRQWSELFDNINLKLSLSYKGINYDFTADIPRKNGFLGATVYYQPITKNTEAQIRLKNIDTASYLSLVNIPDVQLKSGIIKDINLNITYTRDKTSAQGDVLMKDLDISTQGETFKGDIEIRDLDAHYENGDIYARGQMALNNMQTKVPGLTAAGSVQTKINDFEFTQEGVTFLGSLNAQNIFMRLKDRQVQVDTVALDNIKLRKDKDGIQSVGSVSTKGLCVQWPDQKLQGDIILNGMTMQIKDENDIRLEGDLEANDLSTNFKNNKVYSKHLLLERAQLKISDEKNISLTTKLSMDKPIFKTQDDLFSADNIQTDKLLFNLEDGIIKLSSTLNATKAKLFLSNQKTISADPQLELNLKIPLSAPQELLYKGSLTLSNGHIDGFSPFQSFDNIELDTDFQNDTATINALSVTILDTNVRINGTVKNFKKPYLDILAEANEFDLSRINTLIPKIVNDYGLSFNGTSFVKVKFKGLLTDPLDANILAVASVKNVSASSSKFHQQVKNITGIIEATPNSLKWRDFTITYQGKHYKFLGSLNNFKNPRIFASLEGPDIQLKAKLTKSNNIIMIDSLTGKYLHANFNSTGSIHLSRWQAPLFNINTNLTLLLEDLIKDLPPQQRNNLLTLNPTATLSITSDLQGSSPDFKNDTLNATITSPLVTLMGYKLTDLKISVEQGEGKVKNLSLDGKLYGGIVHAVGSLDLSDKNMAYELAFNIDHADLHQFKIDSPFKMNELDGKFYFTSILHGTLNDFKNNVHATGSMAIRDGFLAEFNLFKGLLDVLNDAMDLGKVTFTDAEANFTIENQKIMTDNLRLKGPTIVLLGKGWVNFDEICDLNMAVDLSSGVVPAIAHDVLQSLNIRIYDKISAPKFKKKISVPQVINTLIKNLWQ